ncbi:heme/hemin ABC transporter substrate-binding protein [Gallaecimonas mangrovi]|uniref:heme/hemin ABC transporter substrate-binding protein n=1 Tax=Gallaecimonas mangrovi TaxID=2291597 RepID=UPI000E20BB9C|nr:ABC transporter substrate-binding protein [Gallaecimonas mangrovi]
MKALLWLLLLPLSALAAPRIVTTGASVTQIVETLGGQGLIVGTDSTSKGNYPKLGYFRQLSAEGVLSLKPTELWAAPGTGPAAVLKQLRESGVKVRQLPQAPDLTGLYQHIELLGQWLGKSQEAAALVSQIQAQLDSLAPLNRHPRVLFLLSVGDRGLIAAGQKTWPDTLMKLAGLTNVAASQQGYKPFSKEMLLAKVDLVLIPNYLSAHPEQLCQQQPLSLMGSRCRVRALPATLVMSQGPHVVAAVEALRHALD